MNPFAIKQASFVTSVGQGQSYPAPLYCEIAIVGRSNVGKSTLINCLCGNGKLARTSQTPGKTRLINYYLLNRDFYLVDLPGYGFAKTGKTERDAWGELIGTYLSSGRPRHLFILLDIRHAPSEEDKQMFRWVLYYGVPFSLIATKSDKLSRSARAVSANTAAKLLGAPPFAIPFSGESGEGKAEVLQRLGQIVLDAAALPQTHSTAENPPETDDDTGSS